VTALKEREERLKALEIGADDFLTKPVDRVELLARVKSLLRIKRLYNELTEINETLEQRVQEQVERIRSLSRLEEDLKIARQIQMAFLPKEAPRLEGFEVFGECVPAREVGGDFFDFIPVDEGRLGLVIADVAGKGVPAALFTTMCKGLIWSLSKGNGSPRDVLGRLNRLIFEIEHSDMFITLFYGILDKRERVLRYSNAGHNPPILYREGRVEELELKGKPLGIFEEIELEERVVELQGGDVVVFYTDGVIDAVNGEGERFGEERLRRVILEGGGMSAEVLTVAILERQRDFVCEEPQFDDTTLVVLKVCG